MRFVEATYNNQTSIRLVGDRQGIDTLQEFVTSCALGALESANSGQSEIIKRLIDGVYDLRAITSDLLPTFAKVIDDGNHFIRQDIILKSAQEGRLGLAEYARERRVQAIDVDALFLTSAGVMGYLHSPDRVETEEADTKVRIKPYFWACDTLMGDEATRVAQVVGATCYSYQHEIVPEGSGYNLLTDRAHLVLGIEADSGDFTPLATVLSDKHPARQTQV